jgi:GNAT superfamily N-acetyltransferase
MAAVLVRDATPEDAPALAVLAAQVFVATYAIHGIGPSVVRHLQDRFTATAVASWLGAPGSFVRVIERDGHLLGFSHVQDGVAHEGLTSEELAGPGRLAELVRLYLLPRVHGQGLGRLLLSDAEACAADRGIGTLWLTAWSENATALAFYPRCGHEDRGSTTHVFEGETVPNRLFARRLDGGVDVPRATGG